MNGFGVDWSQDTEDDLATIWLTASDPGAVTQAQAEIDRLLSRNPLGNGQHISEGLYRLVLPPLIVTYTIDQGNRQVEVVSVRTTS